MFDNQSGEGNALNWRGAVLAAGIFAGAFAILLFMARQNQSNTSDLGSSLREDPNGTSLLFDSYGRAGYEVKRSEDEDSLTYENELRTTAFFIDGQAFDWTTKGGNLPSEEKLGRRIADFLARGGRVVLIAPSSKLTSQTQGWEVANQWSRTPHQARTIWVSPVPGAMPEGCEKMFLANDAPWLNTDPAWTALYSGPADAGTGSPGHAYLAMRKVGKGELLAASQQSFLLNEAIKSHPNPALLDFMVGGRPVVWVDETLHGLYQEQGVLWLVQRYRLQVALLLFWLTLMVLLWSMSGDLVRRPIRDRDTHIVRYSESAGVAARRLLQRSLSPGQVVAECWEEFLRRSPQDARAISADPQGGPRLQAALTLPPLAGYRQLSQLIAERRAAKGLARAEPNAPGGSPSSSKTDSEEKGFA